MDDFSPLSPRLFEIAFGVVALLVLTGIVLTIVLAVRNVLRLKKAGLDPLMTEAELAATLVRGGLLGSDRPLEARLAELSDLRDRGLITEEEHAVARAAALRDR